MAEGERKAGVKEVLREGQVSEQEEGWSQGLPRLSVFLGHRHGEVIASAEGREVGAPVRSGVVSVSDSDRRVPAELGQESQASSCRNVGVCVSAWNPSC